MPSVTRLLALAPLALTLLFAAPCRADDPPEVVVERREGQPVRGRLLEFDEGRFRILVGGRVVEVDEDEVREVRFAERRADGLELRAVHEPCVVTARTRPGAIDLSWEHAPGNAYVWIKATELWRRAGEGPWTLLDTYGSNYSPRFSRIDKSVDPRLSYRYKVVTVAEADVDNPVVQRLGLRLSTERQESEVVGPLSPEPGVHVFPSSLLPRGATMVVYAWRDGEWRETLARAQLAEPIGDTGLTLVSGELRPAATGPRLVLTLRRADGSTFEVDGSDLPADLPSDWRFRGVVMRGQERAGDRDAALRAALDDPRPVSLSFDHADVRAVAARLRELTGVDVAWSTAALDATLSLTLQSVPQREALPLTAELMQLELVPWCGVLWLQPRGVGPRWTPPVTGPLAERLEREVVTLELNLPVADALQALAAATGLNVVLSPAARDVIEDEALVTRLVARDLRLRDALTLIVHGADVDPAAGAVGKPRAPHELLAYRLRWTTRGSVVMVLAIHERPTREVLLERLLEGVASRDTTLIGRTLGEDEALKAPRDVIVSAALALADRPGPLTTDVIAAALRVAQDDAGTWNVVGVAADAPQARGSTVSLSVDSRVFGRERAALVSLEDGVVVPLSAAGRVPADAPADLWVEPRDPEVTALAGAVEGLDFSASQAAVALTPGRAFGSAATAPREGEWLRKLPREAVRAGAVFLARSRSGKVFDVRLDRVDQDAIGLTFAPVELAPRPREVYVLPLTVTAVTEPERAAGARESAYVRVYKWDPATSRLVGAAFEVAIGDRIGEPRTLADGRRFDFSVGAVLDDVSRAERQHPTNAGRREEVQVIRLRFDDGTTREFSDKDRPTDPCEPVGQSALGALMGRALNERWDLPRQERELRALLEREPRLAFAWAQLGQVHVGLGRHDEALRAADQALQLDPACVDALVVRYRAHRARQENDEAAAALRRFLQLAPEHPFADEARRALDELSARAVEDERLAAFAFRTGDERRALDAREGATQQSEQAVKGALAWLLRHQSPDGRWDGDGWKQRCAGPACSGPGTDQGDARYDVGLTSLVLLAFAADGQTHRFGPARGQLAKAVRWLLTQQREDGSVGFDPGQGESIYNHAYATQALCELTAMSPDEPVRAAAGRAVAWALAAQNPGLGWKYGVRSGRNDTSVTGTMVMALTAARAAGFEVPDAALEGARAWFLRLTDARGATGYESPGGGSSYLHPNDGRFDEVPCMTALAVSARLALGDARSEDALRKGVRHVLDSLPPGKHAVNGLRGLNYLYWCYGTSAAFQAGGDAWTRWNAALQPALLSRQRAGGCDAGSWDANDEWALAGGRIYATAINALTLQVYHRHPRRP